MTTDSNEIVRFLGGEQIAHLLPHLSSTSRPLNTDLSIWNSVCKKLEVSWRTSFDYLHTYQRVWPIGIESKVHSVDRVSRGLVFRNEGMSAVLTHRDIQ
jgi:hypothetical protein